MCIYFKVANDNGNSEHDIIINDVLISQPNVYSKVRRLPNLDEVNKKYVIENIEDNLIVTCEDPSGIYYIGNYALSSGQKIRNVEVGIDNNKIESDVILINTLAQIAGQAVKVYSLKNKSFKEIIKVKVDMTTALPISSYSSKNAKLFSEKFTNKNHLITVHIGNEIARIEIEFEFVMVIPEGVTSSFLFTQVDDILKKYNFKKQFFKDAKVLHVAIGEGTVEYPITKGIEFNPNFIKGSNNGVGHAIDMALDEFKETKGLIKFSRQDYSEVLKNKKHKYNELAEDIIEQYIEEQAEEIFHNATKEIQKANNDIDVVCVYGGGSILMRSALEDKFKKFCDRADIKLLYFDKEDCITLEALGLNVLVNSKLFNTLKQNSMVKN
ncbi:ParM/StbA family protein [Clostridium perfringens]|nr:ParM/StbA family protein [Clostridium perfringens]